jgi:hypothetical protein
MQKVAQSWLVFDLTKSSFFLGLDDFLGQLPILLFTLVGGVIADRTTAGACCSDRSMCKWRPPSRWRARVLGSCPHLAHPRPVGLTGFAQAFGGPPTRR